MEIPFGKAPRAWAAGWDRRPQKSFERVRWTCSTPPERIATQPSDKPHSDNASYQTSRDGCVTLAIPSASKLARVLRLHDKSINSRWGQLRMTGRELPAWKPPAPGHIRASGHGFRAGRVKDCCHQDFSPAWRCIDVRFSFRPVRFSVLRLSPQAARLSFRRPARARAASSRPPAPPM